MSRKQKNKPLTSPHKIEPSSPPHRDEPIPFLILGFLACLIYGLTLYRSVPGGDSGELIQVAQNLGVAHPPGYPLFTLLGFLFSKIPIGSIAFRVNFLSAVCNAVAALFLALGVSRWSRNRAAGLLAGGLFAFSPLTWSFSVVTEVFGLNNLFIAGLFYLVIRFLDETRVESRTKLLLSCTFCAGLGLTNHHTFVFYALPWVLFLIWQHRISLKPKCFLQLGAFFLLGLSPYLYLPITDHFLKLSMWGHTSSWEGFFTHIFRREYGTFSLSSNHLGTTGIFSEILLSFLSYIPEQVFYIGLFFIPFGIFKSFQSKNNKMKLWAWIFAFSFVFYLGVFFSLSNLNPNNPIFRAVLSRFWQQLNFVLFAWVGLGFSCLSEFLNLNAQNLKKSWILSVGVAVILTFQILVNFKAQDRSQDESFKKLAYLVLNYLPANALLLPTGDYVAYNFQHYQQNEGLRPDVQVIDQFMLTRTWYKRIAEVYFPQVTLPGPQFSPSGRPGTYQLKDFFNANFEKFPLYIMNGLNYNDTSYQDQYTFWPIGLLDWVLPNTQELQLESWIAENNKFTQLLDPASLEKYQPATWEHEILRQYWHRRHMFAVSLMLYARKHTDRLRPTQLAVSILQEILPMPEYTNPMILKNLGSAYEILSQSGDSSARDKMIQTWKQYLEVASPTDQDIPNILKAIGG